MPANVSALQILLILLPGFAVAYIVQLLVLRGSQTDFDKVVEACLFSFLIYSTFLIVAHGDLPFDVVLPPPPSSEPQIHWHLPRLLALMGISLFYAVAGTLFYKFDGNRPLRAVGLTVRTARRSIWNDIFQDVAAKGQILQVELGDKRSILGQLVYYSDAAEDCAIYLAQASWVAEDGKTIPITGPGILITKNSNIQSIALLDAGKPIDPPTAPSAENNLI